MSDLLTHVLSMYVLSTLAVWQIDWFNRRYVGITMLGAVIPDAAKGLLLTGPEFVVFGIRGSWYALQTIGSAVAFIFAGVLLFQADERPAIVGGLSLGVVTHMFLDLLVIRTDGTAPAYLYPLTWAHLPSGDIYLSSDIWPSLIIIGITSIIWYVDRR